MAVVFNRNGIMHFAWDRGPLIQEIVERGIGRPVAVGFDFKWERPSVIVKAVLSAEVPLLPSGEDMDREFLNAARELAGYAKLSKPEEDYLDPHLRSM